MITVEKLRKNLKKLERRKDGSEYKKRRKKVEFRIYKNKAKAIFKDKGNTERIFLILKKNVKDT